MQARGGDRPQRPSPRHALTSIEAWFAPPHTAAAVCGPLVHGGCETFTGPAEASGPVERLLMGGESNFTGEMTSQLAPSDDGSALMGSPQGRSVRLENRHANGHNKGQPLDSVGNGRMSPPILSRPYVHITDRTADGENHERANHECIAPFHNMSEGQDAREFFKFHFLSF